MNADQARQLSLRQLSDRLSPAAHFSDPQAAAPSDTLQAVFAAMERAGYTVSAPFRFYPTRARGYAEWHVQIADQRASFHLAFLVPEGAC
jgi:hypothetical protein